jgi:hypothetical protein
MGARADRGVGMLQGSWGLDGTLRKLDRPQVDGVPTLNGGSIRGAFAICARPILIPDVSAMPSESFRVECLAGRSTPVLFFRVPTETNPIAVP